MNPRRRLVETFYSPYALRFVESGVHLRSYFSRCVHSFRTGLVFRLFAAADVCTCVQYGFITGRGLPAASLEFA
jgi:hypothetical protein